MYFSGNGSRPKQSTVILRRIGELMPIEITHRISCVFSVNSRQERSSELMIRGWKAAKESVEIFPKNMKKWVDRCEIILYNSTVLKEQLKNKGNIPR